MEEKEKLVLSYKVVTNPCVVINPCHGFTRKTVTQNLKIKVKKQAA